MPLSLVTAYRGGTGGLPFTGSRLCPSFVPVMKPPGTGGNDVCLIPILFTCDNPCKIQTGIENQYNLLYFENKIIHYKKNSIKKRKNRTIHHGYNGRPVRLSENDKRVDAGTIIGSRVGAHGIENLFYEQPLINPN